MTTLPDEIARRRTFAIISHPDAGKTTLTEKLLLFGGAIQLAGTVKGLVGDKMHRSITLPAYISDVAKVQFWCAYAEVVLGEASFGSSNSTH